MAWRAGKQLSIIYPTNCTCTYCTCAFTCHPAITPSCSHEPTPPPPSHAHEPTPPSPAHAHEPTPTPPCHAVTSQHHQHHPNTLSCSTEPTPSPPLLHSSDSSHGWDGRPRNMRWQRLVTGPDLPIIFHSAGLDKYLLPSLQASTHSSQDPS